jgi:putative selenate reductase molybdopterin-binding subunit
MAHQAVIARHQIDRALTVNGRRLAVRAYPAESLLNALRQQGLTGAKPACEAGQCGACTVIVNGVPKRACLIPLGQLRAETPVETVEGLAEGEILSPLQLAFVEEAAVQCGYCTSGILMRMTAFLRDHPRPTESAVRRALESNLCRCTGYENIVKAVVRVGQGHAPPLPEREGSSVVGSRIPQLQGRGKVTGSQRFTTDLTAPRLLHAKILRASVAHAAISRIDCSQAWKVPGVVDVITFQDVPDRRYNSAFRNPNDALTLRPDERILNERARHVGDRIAAVAAETKQAALRALAAIEVEYEPLPVYIDPVEALGPDATEIHEGTGNAASEPFVVEFGDVERAMAEAPVSVRGRFRLPAVQHANLEPKAVIAEWDAEGRVTIRATTQVPFHVRTVLIQALDLGADRIRVIAPDLGGGQGERSDPGDEFVAVVLAKRTGRPVKLVNSREEQFTSTRVRHGAVLEASLAANRDGELIARTTTATLATGAYATMGYRVLKSLGIRSAALYRVPNLRYEGRLAYTNTPVAGGMRGFGSPQAAFVVETQLDELAAQLDVNPIDIRIRNLVKPGDPYLDLDENWQIRSAAAVDGLRVVRRLCNWDEKRQGLRAPQPDAMRRGIGVAVGSHISTVMPYYRDHGDALVKLHENGTVFVYTGVPDTGTGSTTIFAQLAAQELGLPHTSIRVVTGDTDLVPYDQGAHSSRTTYVAGEAVRRAAAELKIQICREAASMLECGIDDVELTDGLVKVRGVPSSGVGIEKLAHWIRYESDDPHQLIAERSHLPKSIAPPFAICVAEVAVDPRTGQVRVERMLEAIDCGKPVNPMFVEGQLHGAIHMGLGAALCEEMRFDGQGRPLTRSFAEYQLLRSVDMPEIRVVILDSTEPTGPFGAKGLGEASVVPVAASVANAVAHAVGAHPHELPLTPERVLALMHRP